MPSQQLAARATAKDHNIERFGLKLAFLRDWSAMVPMSGHIIQVIAHDLRLRTNSQDIVANALDQRRLPAGHHRAQRVPCVAHDNAELRWHDSKLLLDIGVGLP